MRHRGSKRRFLGRVKGKPVRYITILPSLVTLLNGTFGFAAIVLASREPSDKGFSPFAMAAYMILVAMVMDMLDGRVARMSHSTSSFGGQLDSLCDVISFGVAPAFLMFKLMQHTLTGDPSSSTLIQRLIWLAALAYVIGATIRLARFNVENVLEESDHMFFMGLPSPAAAGVVASLVLFHQDAVPEWTATLYILPPATVAAAGLMVSRIRYPHVVNQYLKGKKPVEYLFWILLAIGLAILHHQAALVVIFCGFAASGVLRTLYAKILHKDLAPPCIEISEQNQRLSPPC